MLDAAEEAGFDLFITADQELGYQQNLSLRKIAIVVLSTNNWAFIKAHVGLIVAAVDAAIPAAYLQVRIPQRE